MSRVTRMLPEGCIFLHQASAASQAQASKLHRPLRPVHTIINDYDQLSLSTFRAEAFTRAIPAHITTSTNPAIDTGASSQIPAIRRWFDVKQRAVGDFHYRLCQEYFSKYKGTILPYELLAPQTRIADGYDLVSGFRKFLEQKNEHLVPSLPPDVGTSLFIDETIDEVKQPSYPSVCESKILPEDIELLPKISLAHSRFHTFNAPIQLLFEALDHRRLSYLYIAQALIGDLPEQLQKDLPIPRLVKESGKGDIYGANLWMGSPPTYTPLHKDPNPNLFVQLASNKLVRLFSPVVGKAIFYEVQLKIGAQASASFRGDEMMHGPEVEALETAVWDCPPNTNGYEVLVRPGDALFIPQGWWHSIKSVNLDVSASANWWFR